MMPPNDAAVWTRDTPLAEKHIFPSLSNTDAQHAFCKDVIVFLISHCLLCWWLREHVNSLVKICSPFHCSPGMFNPTVSRFPCRICHRVMMSAAGRGRHEKLHMGQGHKCPTCQRQFTLNSDLQRHIIAVHEKRRFVCDQCNQSFSQQCALVHHKKQCSK